MTQRIAAVPPGVFASLSPEEQERWDALGVAEMRAKEVKAPGPRSVRSVAEHLWRKALRGSAGRECHPSSPSVPCPAAWAMAAAWRNEAFAPVTGKSKSWRDSSSAMVRICRAGTWRPTPVDAL